MLLAVRGSLSLSIIRTLSRKTAVLPNGIIACWHPEQPHPYEHTKPIDFKQTQKPDSLLRDEVLHQKPQAPSNLELREIFYVPKNEWYPRNFLLCLEHHPVYTVGLRSKLYSPAEESRLQTLGADFHRTDRGGLITFHGPGQLVVYPIFDLRRFSPLKFTVKKFVHALEQAVVDCATLDFSIPGVHVNENTGVWTSPTDKLCSIGIAVKEGVTSHGIALNCNNDLSWFDHIIACGIQNARATSLSRATDSDVAVDDVVPLLLRRMEHTFGVRFES